MYVLSKGLVMEDLKKVINVLIVDDSKLSRMIFKKMIVPLTNFNVCGDFDNAEDCIRYIKSNKVDLVLMDMELPYMNGIDASCIIKELNPDIKVLLFSANNEEPEIIASLFANVNAYLLKDITQIELLEVINTVMHGGAWVDSRIQHMIINYIKCLPEKDSKYLKKLLNPTESILIKMIAVGWKKHDIAKYLKIHLSDLTNYVYSIFNKLSKTEKAENAVKEFKYGFIETKCV